VLQSELELVAYTEDEPPLGARVEEVEPGWEDRWREFHRPVRAGPFWIGAPWEQPPGDAVPLVIDPGRAFGTGAHATTRLCVELVAELEPTSLIDIGCGSGVIAIAAALRGFSPVVAIDVDPAAVDATQRNASANGVVVDAQQLDAEREDLPGADVAVANISLELVQTMLERVDAKVVVTSGYLERDEPRAAAFRRRERRVREGWAADLFERAE
jgi:ribosomal protein L11 methyltransferase